MFHISISNFKSNDVAKSPTLLGNLLDLSLLWVHCSIEKVFWVQHLNINIFRFAEGWTCSNFFKSFYLDLLRPNIFGAVRVLALSYISFVCFIQHFSYSRKQCLLDAWFALLELFWTCNVKTFDVTVMFPFW